VWSGLSSPTGAHPVVRLGVFTRTGAVRPGVSTPTFSAIAEMLKLLGCGSQ